MDYSLNIDAKFEDWFAPLDGTEGNFKFSIFFKDGVKIIPVTISQGAHESDSLEYPEYKKTINKKLVLGRNRIIYLLNGGRKEYIVYNKIFLSISDARKLESSKKNKY